MKSQRKLHRLSVAEGLSGLLDTSTRIRRLFFRELYTIVEKASAETLATAELQRQRKKQRRCGYEARRLEAECERDLEF